MEFILKKSRLVQQRVETRIQKVKKPALWISADKGVYLMHEQTTPLLRYL